MSTEANDPMVKTAQRPRNFIVEGANWKCRVTMDSDDMEMEFIEQVQEAATKAVEVFFGHAENHTFQVVIPENPPEIGCALCVYDEIDAANEGRYYFVQSHIPLANAGHYKESAEVIKVLAKNEEVRQKEFIKMVGGQEKFEQLKKETDKMLAKKSKGGKIRLSEKDLLEISEKLANKMGGKPVKKRKPNNAKPPKKKKQ